MDALGDGGGGVPLSIQELLNISPNSGFNWQHVNTINADLPIKALIDPVTQLEVAQAVRLLRLTGPPFPAAGGGVYYAPSDTEEAQTTVEPEGSSTEPPQNPPQNQVIILQPAAAQPLQRPNDDNDQVTTKEETPDQSGLVLVLRSGKQIRVAAFMRENDRIVYITPEGDRLSIAAGDLDPGTTARVNSERGTP